MADTARLVELSIRQAHDGTPGYKLENPFGQSVQILPKPPGFRATVVLEWKARCLTRSWRSSNAHDLQGSNEPLGGALFRAFESL